MADDVTGLESVATVSGRVEGERRGGHTAFRGIPYAVAERFAAPRPARSWTGVRRCREIGLAAPQSEHFIAGFAASGPQGEDCLNLNVFTPATDGARRPVMVWIHGGGFTHGAGYEALYDGGPLAERGDVVVVTLNYRLGALGFLRLPEIGATGNQGLLDQIAALAWVRDNIAGFGGDPDQVTIFGESAGSASVGCLVAMPAARGLFKRAIYQSGVGRAAPPEAADRATDTFLKTLGLDRSRAAELKTLPAEALVKAQAGFGPVRDPDSLPEDPAKVVKDGGAAGLDLMIGLNRDEVKLFVASRQRDPIDDAALVKGVRDALPKSDDAQASEVTEVIRASRQTKGLPFDNLDVLDAVQSAARFGIPSMRLALAQSSHRDAYLYLFTHASPARRGALGACHALEMPFVFGTLSAPTQDRFAGTGPDVERLSTDMMDAWLAFARTGNPSCAAVGAWPAYREPGRATMIFDTASSHVENDPFGEERRVIEPLV